MTDLSEIKVIERDIEILHPATKEELGVTVTLMSPLDQRLDKLRNQLAQKQLSVESKGKVLKVDEIRENRKRVLFAAITKWNWRGDVNWQGEKPELNPKMFNEIADELPWFIDQLDEAFGETERFFQRPETI